jgi:type II secretory ATPase GspE/PulE/Tfp pilus assembly ATPase PilB-like protein
MTIKVRAEESKFTITDIGLTEEQITKLKPILDMKSGLILVSGLGSSGVTTTLYAIGRSLDAFMQNIHSVEMKPLMELDNITQNIFHGGDDKSFPKLIQSISRREPDVILIDPCQDAETAKMLVQIVADKKKKIFTVVRASNALSALARFVRWSENPSASSEVIQAVSFVRLLRKLCPTCREAYHPNADTLRKMNISANSQVTFYRPPTQLVDKKGRPMICTTCQGSGYVGRTGVFELLIMNDQIREAILSGDNSRLKSAARKSGCKSWEEMALEKIMSGVTSVQEVIRVSKEAELAAGKAKQR